MGSSPQNPLFSGSDDSQVALLVDQPPVASSSGSAMCDWMAQFPEIIGRSHKMSKVLETVNKITKSASPVLILGESGTGKELIAAAIHRLSSRCHQNFIPINCSAIPEDLLESELFGHEKGAFTGADRKRVGKFEAARGGTIFLDEIGDMSPRLQAKLLRVLQEMSLTPLGSNEQKKIDVRVVAATNIDLAHAIKENKFRLDLFYRLNVLPVTLPSLKEREGDALLLLEHFLDEQNRSAKFADPCWFVPDALRALGQFNWPGNIRQLQNMVERLVVFKGGGRIGIDDLPEEIVDYYRSQQQSRATSSQNPEQPAHSPFDVSSERASACPSVGSGEAGHPPGGSGNLEGRRLCSPDGQRLAPPERTSLTSDLTLNREKQGTVDEDLDLDSRKPRAVRYPSQFPAHASEQHSQLEHITKLPGEGVDLKTFVLTIENSLIMQALERTSYNKQQAAKLLGLNRTTLVERIRKRTILAKRVSAKDS